jgi:hypothetical protein
MPSIGNYIIIEKDISNVIAMKKNKSTGSW